MAVYWNWKLTRDGVIRFGLMLAVFSIVYQNVIWLNSKFLSQLPIGYILLICFGYFSIRHIYRTLKWYKIWFKYGVGHKFENFMIHVCIYLIVTSISLSVPSMDMFMVKADAYVNTPLTTEPTQSSVKSPTTEIAPVKTVPTVNELEPEPDTKPTEVEEEITSSTLWIDYNTYMVGGDGHTIEIMNNNKARDPTYDEMIRFIKDDQTDKLEYIPDKFVCADFAEQIQHNAEIAGYNCAYVCVDFTEGEGHACNAFNTKDRGLVFIDCTGYYDSLYTTNADYTININRGSAYVRNPLFPNPNLIYSDESIGTVKDYRVYW